MGQIPVRLFSVLLPVVIFSACNRNSELSDTLAWMDNTYNPHPDVAGAYGHGKSGWYFSGQGNESRPGGERLASGSIQKFTLDGCKIKLQVDDNPAASVHSEVYGTYISTFNLHDINPRSIDVSTYSRKGGFRCENYTPQEREIDGMDCDHAEIVFRTHSEAPVIETETHITYVKLQGSEHQSTGKGKSSLAYFVADDVEYARRFATAFGRAVELCGGKPEAFEPAVIRK